MQNAVPVIVGICFVVLALGIGGAAGGAVLETSTIDGSGPGVTHATDLAADPLGTHEIDTSDLDTHGIDPGTTVDTGTTVITSDGGTTERIDVDSTVEGPREVSTPGFDRSTIEITVTGDGSGVWTLRYERTLTSADEREEFETFAERFRNEETDLYRSFHTDATALVEAGNETTDREMAADGFGRDAFIRSSLGNDIGVVELTFAWHGFATVDDDVVIVGDVFEGGFYVGPNQELVVRPAEEIAFDAVDPEGTQADPDSLIASASVTWDGERQFTDQRPRIVFVPSSAAETEDSNATAETTEPSDAIEESSVETAEPKGSSGAPFGGSLPWVLLGTILVIVAATIAWRRRVATPPGSTGSNEAAGLNGATGPDVPTDPNGSTGYGSENEPAGPVSGPTEDSSSWATGAAPIAPAVPDEELESDEKRVVSFIRENGGRVKQSRIVEETDWSKSKVSVLLSEMEEDGTVSKLRIGRENVVSLDGCEPDAAGSPFDERGDIDGSDR